MRGFDKEILTKFQDANAKKKFRDGGNGYSQQKTVFQLEEKGTMSVVNRYCAPVVYQGGNTKVLAKTFPFWLTARTLAWRRGIPIPNCAFMPVSLKTLPALKASLQRSTHLPFLSHT